MGDRFTFKDFVFVVCLLLVVGAVIFAINQFSYQEKRVSELRQTVDKMVAAQSQQTQVLEQIRDTLRSGVRVPETNSAGTAKTQPAGGGVERIKTADGGAIVRRKGLPASPRNPRVLPNYTTGDWLVLNITSEPSFVTPYLEKDAYGSDVQDFVTEQLIRRNPETLEWEPYLAESYEIIPSKLTYRFVLRNDIHFSDGKPITMDDVMFSYNTVMNPEIEAPRMQAYTKMFKEIRRVDDRTLEVEMKEPYFMGLDVAGGFIEIIPRHIYQFNAPKEYNERTDLLVASGPFIFDKSNWKKGQEIVLVRNEKYWGLRPSFDRVVLRFITNPQAALQEYQAGQIDYHIPTPDQFNRLSADEEFAKSNTVYKFRRPNSGYRYIGWNLRKPMFADKLTRQALTQLVDRDSINKVIMQGLAYNITGPFSPMVPQANPNLQPWPYNPDDARKKLGQAGWKPNARGILERNGEEFKFSLIFPSQNPIGEQITAYVKEQYRKVGIEVTLSPLEFSVLVEKLDTRNFDAAMLGWTGSIEGDPTQIWHSASAEKRGSNFVGFINKEADELIDTGKRELDVDKRMAKWHAFHALIHEEQPYLFLHASMSTAFIKPRIENTKPYVVGVDTADWFVPAALQKYR